MEDFHRKRQKGRLAMTSIPFDDSELADTIEQVAARIVSALRNRGIPHPVAPAGQMTRGSTAQPSAATSAADVDPKWTEVEPIEQFEAVWPAPEAWKAQGHDQMHEHYGPMRVFDGNDGNRVVRLAVGAPEERYEFYGKERGWVSVWEVANDRPVRQLANFIEVDDFDQTGDRAALISGKDGAAKKGFAPTERHLLPAVYDGMRIEVQRDRIVGPYSRNRLVVIARDDEIEVMLNHALAHLRLRS
jgi:hypothetical protein